MRLQRFVPYTSTTRFLCLWLALVLLSLSVQSEFACGHEGHAALPSKGLTVSGNELLLSEGARKAIDIATAKVSLADLARTIECNARIELPWSQQALVTTQVPGRIIDLHVRPGDAVKTGQELARVESLELESLQLAMLQADTELSLARDQYQRRSDLAKQGAIAGRAAIDAETSLKQTTADLQIALCKLRAVGIEQQTLDEIRRSRQPLVSFAVVSPISGMVAEADVLVGQQVKTTEHLFHIVDSSTVWVIGNVLEADIWKVKSGQRATVKFTSLPDRPLSGTIDQLRLKLDDKQRTRAVVMESKNPNQLLRAGMFGRMTIEVAAAREAVVCPVDGIILDSGKSFVLLKRGEGKYVRQPVQMGIRDGDQVEILDGLFPGDQVVTTGNHVLFSLFGGSEPSATAAANIQDKSATAAEVQPSVAPDARGQGATEIVAQGIVELPTDRKAFTGSRIEGRISRIHVRHGQPVKAGDILAEVDSLELRNVQGELLETEAKLSWTSQRVELLTPLAQQNIVSRSELLELQKDEDVLAAKRDSLLRQLSMIGAPKEQVDRLRKVDLSAENCNVEFVRSVPIRAAIDGAVADFNVVPGQVVDSQAALFEIHDTTQVWVRGHLFQQDAIRVEVGQPVRLTFADRPDITVTGKVVRLSPILEATERVLPLWVEVDNSDGRLIEGMWARMEIDVDGKPLAVTQDSSTSYLNRR